MCHIQKYFRCTNKTAQITIGGTCLRLSEGRDMRLFLIFPLFSLLFLLFFYLYYLYNNIYDVKEKYVCMMSSIFAKKGNFLFSFLFIIVSLLIRTHVYTYTFVMYICTFILFYKYAYEICIYRWNEWCKTRNVLWQYITQHITFHM